MRKEGDTRTYGGEEFECVAQSKSRKRANSIADVYRLEGWRAKVETSVRDDRYYVWVGPERVRPLKRIPSERK